MKLAYFMRKPDLIGKRYSFQGTTHYLGYDNDIYFRFLISDTAADWIENRSITHKCYLKPEMLRATLNANSIGDDHFIDDHVNNKVIDISHQPLDVVILHIDDEDVVTHEDGGV
jgi:hypothetical protein